MNKINKAKDYYKGLHLFLDSINKLRSFKSNTSRQNRYDHSDENYVQAMNDVYNTPDSRLATIGNYEYDEKLSSERVAVYKTHDSAIVAFRGTASADEARQAWGAVAKSEAHYQKTNFYKQTRKITSTAVNQLKNMGIKNSAITFTGHSLGGTDAIIAESLLPESKAVVFNAGQGAMSSINDKAKKNIKNYSIGGDVVSFLGFGRYGQNIMLPKKNHLLEDHGRASFLTDEDDVIKQSEISIPAELIQYILKKYGTAKLIQYLRQKLPLNIFNDVIRTFSETFTPELAPYGEQIEFEPANDEVLSDRGALEELENIEDMDATIKEGEDALDAAITQHENDSSLFEEGESKGGSFFEEGESKGGSFFEEGEEYNEALDPDFQPALEDEVIESKTAAQISEGTLNTDQLYERFPQQNTQPELPAFEELDELGTAIDETTGLLAESADVAEAAIIGETVTGAVAATRGILSTALAAATPMLLMNAPMLQNYVDKLNGQRLDLSKLQKQKGIPAGFHDQLDKYSEALSVFSNSLSVKSQREKALLELISIRNWAEKTHTLKAFGLTETDFKYPDTEKKTIDSVISYINDRDHTQSANSNVSFQPDSNEPRFIDETSYFHADDNWLSDDEYNSLVAQYGLTKIPPRRRPLRDDVENNNITNNENDIHMDLLKREQQRSIFEKQLRENYDAQWYDPKVDSFMNYEHSGGARTKEEFDKMKNNQVNFFLKEKMKQWDEAQASKPAPPPVQQPAPPTGPTTGDANLDRQREYEGLGGDKMWGLLHATDDSNPPVPDKEVERANIDDDVGVDVKNTQNLNTASGIYTGSNHVAGAKNVAHLLNTFIELVIDTLQKQDISKIHNSEVVEYLTNYKKQMPMYNRIQLTTTNSGKEYLEKPGNVFILSIALCFYGQKYGFRSHRLTSSVCLSLENVGCDDEYIDCFRRIKKLIPYNFSEPNWNNTMTQINRIYENKFKQSLKMSLRRLEQDKSDGIYELAVGLQSQSVQYKIIDEIDDLNALFEFPHNKFIIELLNSFLSLKNDPQSILDYLLANAIVEKVFL